MDAKELRRSMIREVKESASAEEVQEREAETSWNVERLLREARSVSARFRAIQQSPERRKLQEIYEDISRLVDEMRQPVESADAGEEKERQSKFGKRTADLIEEARKITRRAETLDEKVEKGRKRLVEKAAAGTGKDTYRRIRDELNYLLDHYTRSNDTKIEILLDKWRRSGDPSYDPAIKIRYRNVRKNKDSEDYAF